MHDKSWRKNWHTCIVHTSGNETVAYQCHQTVCISHSSNCQTQCHTGYSFVTPATIQFTKQNQTMTCVISLNCLQYCTDYKCTIHTFYRSTAFNKLSQQTDNFVCIIFLCPTVVWKIQHRKLTLEKKMLLLCHNKSLNQ